MNFSRWMQTSGFDFRAAATFGVALTALALLLPFSFVNLLQQQYFVAAGTLSIVLVLAANAWLVYHRRCHQTLTLFGLVPCGMTFMLNVYEHSGIVASVWCFPSILACYCMLTQRRAWIANALILAFALPMIWQTLDFSLAIRFTATLSAVSVFSAILLAVIDVQQRQMHDRLIHDPMTGALNRQILNQSIDTAIAQRKKQGVPSALIALDIDYFKQVNDSFGHDVGDQVLRDLVALLTDLMRPEDLIFRTGGEEFLVLLHDTSLGDACCDAELIRVAVEQKRLLEGRPVTVSIGVTECNPHEDRQSLTRRADRLLYLAKSDGRNCVRSDVDWSESELPENRAVTRANNVVDISQRVNA